MIFCIISITLILLLILYILMVPKIRNFGFGKSFQMDGRTIVVTGAGSGIGLELCIQIAKKYKECRIIMIDLCAKRLAETSKTVRSAMDPSQQQSDREYVYAMQCDITDQESFHKCLNAINDMMAKESSYVSVLINNAGVVTGKWWHELSVESFQKTMCIGSTSHFMAIKAFLPSMQKHNDGYIVCMSSLMGVLPGCQLTDYCASKHATLGLHRALQLELECTPGNQVHMMAVCPYVVNTGMFDGAFEDKSLWLTRWLFPPLRTVHVVSEILYGMEQCRAELFLPNILTFAASLSNLLPIRFCIWCLQIAGGAKGMKTFRGHSQSSI